MFEKHESKDVCSRETTPTSPQYCAESTSGSFSVNQTFDWFQHSDLLRRLRRDCIASYCFLFPQTFPSHVSHLSLPSRLVLRHAERRHRGNRDVYRCSGGGCGARHLPHPPDPPAGGQAGGDGQRGGRYLGRLGSDDHGQPDGGRIGKMCGRMLSGREIRGKLKQKRYQ